MSRGKYNIQFKFKISNFPVIYIVQRIGKVLINSFNDYISSGVLERINNNTY